MKKIIIIFLFFLVLALPVNGQLKAVLVPGINCGVPNDIATSKCCTPTVTTISAYLPDFGPAFNTVRDLILGPGFLFIKGKMQPWIDYQTSLIKPCVSGTKSTADPADPDCRCIDTAPTPGAIDNLKQFCSKLKNSSEQTNCAQCITNGGVWTGIGCVQGDVRKFISETVFGIGIGLAGAVSLLCIIYAAFMMQSSQGNPEKLKKAQELLTSCIMGLMLIIFSVFILRLVGVDILRIPGFS